VLGLTRPTNGKVQNLDISLREAVPLLLEDLNFSNTKYSRLSVDATPQGGLTG